MIPLHIINNKLCIFCTVLGTSSSKKTLHNRGSISSSTQSIHSLSSMPGDMSQVDGRVGRWALGFDKLMEDPAGLGCFKVHTTNYFLYDICRPEASSLLRCRAVAECQLLAAGVIPNDMKAVLVRTCSTNYFQ